MSGALETTGALSRPLQWSVHPFCFSECWWHSHTTVSTLGIPWDDGAHTTVLQSWSQISDKE